MPELLLLGLVTWGYLTHLRTKAFLHILQLEEYFTGQYVRWLTANPPRYLVTMLGALAVPIIVVLTLTGTTVLVLMALLAWAALGALIAYFRPKRTPKKPLIMTARARRLVITALGLCAMATGLAIGLGLLAGGQEAAAAGVAVGTLVCLFAGHVLALANVLLYPVEEMSRRKFQRQAEQKLRQRRPRIIAITGSAGKTTTKELVAHLLSRRFLTLKTPSSFNTPMGISRTVNDALTDQEYFIVEMGAYKRGEIAKLCRLVGGTDISVITTVNAQHLERFGSLEKTAQAKFEIIDGLKAGGTAVLNFDVPAVRDRIAAYDGIEVLSFGVESEDADLRATNVREAEGGIDLDVTYRGGTVHVATGLLGRHNAGNVLAAVAVGLVCGLDLGYMAAAARQFHSPEHRLQPVKLPNDVTVLDDGYNANPEGIIGALEVLSAYAPKRRILVTPGLIEMGREKASYHAKIGKAAARTVDVAVLVGPRQTSDIKEAMLEANFPAENIHVTRSLDEARVILETIAAGNAAVLYANDLPDQYDEFLAI